MKTDIRRGRSVRQIIEAIASTPTLNQASDEAGFAEPSGLRTFMRRNGMLVKRVGGIPIIIQRLCK